MENSKVEKCDTSCDVMDEHKKIFDISSLHFSKTMSEISKLRSKSLLFDVVIKSDGKSFQAHKLLLAASSEYFRAMFAKNQMMESEQLEVTINGISAGIEHILDYIYTAKLELTLRNVQEILSAGTYFQLTTVVDACLNYLEGEIDIENCIDVLILSENYSLESLREKILKFICSHLLEISKESDFYRLQEHHVEELLSSDLPVDCSEVEMLNIILTWIITCDKTKKCGKILKHLNFCEMPVNEVEKVLKNLELKKSDELYNLTWSYVVPHKAIDTQNDHKLLNRRGLEMAIVKIGGFERTGITNEVSFSFLTSENSSAIDEAWRYLTEIPHLKQGDFGVAVLFNCLFVIGGSYDISLEHEEVHPFGFKFNPLSSEWSTIKPMNYDRCRFSLNVIGDCLIAVGGHSEGIVQQLEQEGNFASVEKYDPQSDSWTMLAPMPQQRCLHAGTTYKNKLYISGGSDRFGNMMDSFYEYDLGADLWTKISHLRPRVGHVMLRTDTKIYFCGGWEDENGEERLIPEIDCYDIATSTVTLVTHIPTPRYFAGIVLMRNKIFIIGGFAGGDIFRHTASKIEVYDIAEDKWHFPEKYPKHIWEHALTTIYIPKDRTEATTNKS